MRTQFLLLTALISLSSHCLANDILSMSFDEFYAIEENQKQYEQMLESGQFEKVKEPFKASCIQQAKNDKELGYCSCATSEIDKIDRKVLFYESLFSFHAYQAKVAAKSNGDEAEYARLQKLSDEREGLDKMLEKKCGKE